jgi:hypothetical protein
MSHHFIKILAVSASCLILASSCEKKPDQDLSFHNVDTLSQSVYTVQRSVAAQPNGVILLSPFISADFTLPGRLMVMDGDGHLLMEKKTATAAICFRRWILNGKLRYSWIQTDNSYFGLPGVGQLPGYVVIADERLNEIKRVNLMAHGNINLTRNEGIDGHDFLLLAEDHYITISYYQKKVTNIPAALAPAGSAEVIAPIIQEVKNDHVIWQWDGTDHPEFYSTSVEGNNFSNAAVPHDYIHLNSIAVDPNDNNLICSFRQLDQIVKINRQTGEIIWRLGGKNSDFPLTAEQRFLRQHDATLADDNQTLMLFDNGDAKLRPYSRVLEFRLDEQSRTVTGFKQYVLPAPFSMYMGSVQKNGDRYFIGGGSANYVLEVDQRNGGEIMRMTGDRPTYRAYKYQ